MPSSVEIQREHFEQAAAQFDTRQIIEPPLHVKEELDVIKQVIQRIAPQTTAVIDFGAGSGRLTIPLLQSGLHVIAVDISESSLRRLHALADETGCSDRLRSTTSLPSERSHSLIAGTDVLHHVRA
jgi:2-polyprenyl-3-methyl-5-hydroxy-6-metoxy-1,4-benzoquinol methylase